MFNGNVRFGGNIGDYASENNIMNIISHLMMNDPKYVLQLLFFRVRWILYILFSLGIIFGM